MTAVPLTVPDVTTGEFFDPDQVLDLLEDAVKHKKDIMAQAIAAGDNVTTQDSDSIFFHGYLACLVVKRYGKNAIAEFAKGIRMPVDRIKEYRTVCRYYKRSVVAEFRREHPYLTYSHFRKAKRFKDLDRSLEFLEEVERGTWTVEETDIRVRIELGEEVPPIRKTWEVDVLGATPDGRLIVKVPGVSTESILELVGEHKGEEEFLATLTVTHAAPKEESEGTSDANNH